MHPVNVLKLSLVVAALLTLAYCGREDSQNEESGAAPQGSGLIPASWDGLSDWNGSDWKVETP